MSIGMMDVPVALLPTSHTKLSDLVGKKLIIKMMAKLHFTNLHPGEQIQLCIIKQTNIEDEKKLLNESRGKGVARKRYFQGRPSYEPAICDFSKDRLKSNEGHRDLYKTIINAQGCKPTSAAGVNFGRFLDLVTDADNQRYNRPTVPTRRRCRDWPRSVPPTNSRHYLLLPKPVASLTT
jgi:hypothetical protein